MSKKKKAKRKQKLLSSLSEKSYITEQYKTIRTNIHFSMMHKNLQTIVVISAFTGEGKSTTAANIAITFAEDGKKVALVDADMRKPTLHDTFQMNSIIGLSNVLIRQWELEDVIEETMIPNLHLLSCGHIPSNPTELLNSKSMLILLEKLKSYYDIIIIDAPPILVVPDAQVLAHICDGAILVLQANKTKIEQALKAKEALQKSNAYIIGTVLNQMKVKKKYYQNAYFQDVKMYERPRIIKRNA